jgi:hypothetical protein
MQEWREIRESKRGSASTARVKRARRRYNARNRDEANNCLRLPLKRIVAGVSTCTTGGRNDFYAAALLPYDVWLLGGAGAERLA